MKYTFCVYPEIFNNEYDCTIISINCDKPVESKAVDGRCELLVPENTHECEVPSYERLVKLLMKHPRKIEVYFDVKEDRSLLTLIGELEVQDHKKYIGIGAGSSNLFVSVFDKSQDVLERESQEIETYPFLYSFGTIIKIMATSIFACGRSEYEKVEINSEEMKGIKTIGIKRSAIIFMRNYASELTAEDIRLSLMRLYNRIINVISDRGDIINSVILEMNNSCYDYECRDFDYHESVLLNTACSLYPASTIAIRYETKVIGQNQTPVEVLMFYLDYKDKNQTDKLLTQIDEAMEQFL